MSKAAPILLFLFALFLFSCDEYKNCECEKIHFTYDMGYQVQNISDVECTDNFSDGVTTYEYDDYGRLEYAYSMFCEE